MGAAQPKLSGRERELQLRLHNSGPLSHFPKNRKKEMQRNRQELMRYFTLFAALKRV
jgi:DnaJ-domain-containing protein 1